MAKNHLSIEDYYGLAAIGLCKSGLTYEGDKSKFSTYAYKCMLNEVLQDKRKEKSGRRIPQHQIVYYEAELETCDGDTASFLNFIPSDEDVEGDALSKTMFDEYSKQLSDRDKQVFILFSEGYKQREICKIVGISQPHVSRIKKKLEEYLSS